jgi:hypothetical protein
LAENGIHPNGTIRDDGNYGLLRFSPNWNALAGGLALATDLGNDPFADVVGLDRTAWVERRNRIVQAIYPAVLGRLRSGVEAGIQQGYTPPHIGHRLEVAFTHTAAWVVDPAVLEPGVLGMYEPATDMFLMSADVREREMPVVIAHELVGHKTSGGTFRRSGTDPQDPIVRSRIGFAEKEDRSQLDEAVRHHMSLAYLDGDFATVDPDKRTDGNTQYYSYRKLLAEFVERSGGVIDLRRITRGSYEDTDEIHTETADRREMMRQSRTAYGPGAYRKLQTLLQAADTIADVPGSVPGERERMQALINRIHPRTINADGSVSPGSIDITGLPQ